MLETYRICKGGGATMVEIGVRGSSDSWSPELAAPAIARWVRYSPEEGRWMVGAEATILILSSVASPLERASCSPLARSGGSLDSREHGEVFRGHFQQMGWRR